MIQHNGRDIYAIHAGGKAIAVVYRGAVIVWQAIRSCFGKGFWVNAKGWINEEPWRNI